MEWYQQVHEAHCQKYLAKHARFYTHPDTDAIDPFRIADDRISLTAEI